MKRIIKRYASLEPEYRNMLTALHPQGVEAKDVTSFTDFKGNRFLALELKTDDAIILVRFERDELEYSGSAYPIDDDDDDDDDDDLDPDDDKIKHEPYVED